MRFTDTSTDVDGEVAAWNWTFGSVHASTAQHPAHRFAEPGNETIRLCVTDDEGGHDETARMVRVYDDRPHAAFTVPSSPTSAPTPRNLSAPWHPAVGEVWLDGDGPADFGGGDVTYRVYREGLHEGRSLAAATDDAAAFRDRPPAPDRYDYTVEAVDAAGAGPPSEVAQAPGVRAPPAADAAHEAALGVDPLAQLGVELPTLPR